MATDWFLVPVKYIWSVSPVQWSQHCKRQLNVSFWCGVFFSYNLQAVHPYCFIWFDFRGKARERRYLYTIYFPKKGQNRTVEGRRTMWVEVMNTTNKTWSRKLLPNKMHSGESLIPYSFQEAVQINPRLEAGIFKVMKRRRRKKVKDFLVFLRPLRHIWHRRSSIWKCAWNRCIFFIFSYIYYFIDSSAATFLSISSILINQPIDGPLPRSCRNEDWKF